MPVSETYNEDCILGMARYPDKFFELAIVDPPYGVGENWKKDRYSKFYTHSSSYKNNTIPDRKYFNELFRVSKSQIVWGANYYTEFLPARQGWIVWDKQRSLEDSHMAEGELAWHSFNIPLRIVPFRWNGFLTCEKRYGAHPHEKPTGLYQWLLKNYAKPGNKILDTHLGSGSSRIAAFKMGFDFYGWELDTDYFEAQERRFKAAIAEPLFDQPKSEQGKLL
jgi:site-specific DNA-methyltransferase (adenine-specific)